VNRKWFIPAGVFLAVALIVPPYILITQHDADVDNLVSQAPNLADETQAPGILSDIDQRNIFIYAIVAVVEAAAVLLFLVCLWLALRP
jgi:hypothetical protein